MSQRTKSILIALVALVVALVLDQWTKAWAWEHLKPAAPGQPDRQRAVLRAALELAVHPGPGPVVREFEASAPSR